MSEEWIMEEARHWMDGGRLKWDREENWWREKSEGKTAIYSSGKFPSAKVLLQSCVLFVNYFSCFQRVTGDVIISMQELKFSGWIPH